MSSIHSYIYSADTKNYTGINLDFYPEEKDYDLKTVTQRLQQLMEALTIAHTYRPFLGKPVDTNETAGMLTEPIDSELGSTFAALLAFSAARGKDEHPATLIKALVYGLVRYHHTAYLQDKTAPAGDFTKLMTYILMDAWYHADNMYDEDDEAAAPDPNHGQYATNVLAATSIECPQCEKVFTDPTNTDAIGDHALCTTCLTAWRATAAMQNYAPGDGCGDGYSEQPPFLPIPEWWAARGLEVPKVDFSPSSIAQKWKEELPPTADRDLGAILAELAYDEAFKGMEQA